MERKEKMANSWKGVVQGNVVVLEEVKLPEGMEVWVTPVERPPKGSPKALLEVAGTDIPDAWEELERIVEEHDRMDREYERAKAR